MFDSFLTLLELATQNLKLSHFSTSTLFKNIYIYIYIFLTISPTNLLLLPKKCLINSLFLSLPSPQKQNPINSHPLSNASSLDQNLSFFQTQRSNMSQIEPNGRRKKQPQFSPIQAPSISTCFIDSGRYSVPSSQPRSNGGSTCKPWWFQDHLDLQKNVYIHLPKKYCMLN